MTDEELIAIVDQADRTMTPVSIDPSMQRADWEEDTPDRSGRPSGCITIEWRGRKSNVHDIPIDTAAGIAALRNNAGAIAQALRRLTQERDAASGRVLECCREGTRVTSERNAALNELRDERERRAKAEAELEKLKGANQ